MTKFLEAIKIILFGVFVAIVYGIAHDMVTAHVYVEYFTVHHMHVVDSESPVVMALVWGVIATWWVGLFASFLWCGAALAGPLPLLPFRQLAKIISLGALILLGSAMAVLAVLYLAYPVLPIESFRFDRPMNRQLFSVGGTHLFSYFAAAVFAFGVAVIVIYRRIKMKTNLSPDMEEFMSEPK